MSWLTTVRFDQPSGAYIAGEIEQILLIQPRSLTTQFTRPSDGGPQDVQRGGADLIRGEAL